MGKYYRWITHNSSPLLKNNKISVKSVVELEETQDLFHLPLYEEAYEQYSELDIYLQLIQHDSQVDSWTYIWGNDRYSSAKTYKHLMGSQQTHPAFKWILSTSCQLKHKAFFWLHLRDRLNTRGLLRRKSMQSDPYTCELCILQKEEKRRHLFLRCPFAKKGWMTIGVAVRSWLRPESHKQGTLRETWVTFCNGYNYNNVMEYLE
jgi:hypothetical protein